jgi:hypothetical protein
MEQDGKVMMISSVAVNHVEKGHLGDTSMGVTTFLCDKCDRTHIVFQCDAMDEQFNMALDPRDAEKLANMLTNPRLETKA